MTLDFNKMNGLIPAIIQDDKTQKVLMLGFMNEEAYDKTLKTGKVTFWSRTKNALWTKGETSGNYLNVVSIKADCDNDTLLIKVNPDGPVCHTGTDTCWGEENDTFVLQEWKTTPDYLEYAKVRMNGTTFIEEHFKDRKDMHHGIYVDIMILHKVPKGKLSQKVSPETLSKILKYKNLIFIFGNIH